MTTVIREKSIIVGSCSFCTGSCRIVTVINGNGVETRICDLCLSLIFDKSCRKVLLKDEHSVDYLVQGE